MSEFSGELGHDALSPNRNRALSSGNSADGSGHSMNRTPAHAFENVKVKSYSHKPNIIPPYVLDTLTQAHYKQQLDNSNVNAQQTNTNPSIRTSQSKVDDEEQYASFSNDPFVKSMGNNWNNLLRSVEQRTAYAPGRMKFDDDFNGDWKLDGPWGGEDRLKTALLGQSSTEEDSYMSEELGCLGFFRRNKTVSKNMDHDHPKVRSKAGYWMSDEKRKDVAPLLKRIFVQNPLFPLLLRILVICFSACALALACSIFVLSKHKYNGKSVDQQPSTIMAIVVQCCAIVYLIYIAYDEYSGKPLGLRNPLGKMKLIMLDLLFIIFSSANLSLAFNTLYDGEWVCAEDDTPALKSLGIFTPIVSSICRRQRALAALLFLILCLWVLTFTISIVRVVDRVSVSPRND